jgi:hypothetical protein
MGQVRSIVLASPCSPRLIREAGTECTWSSHDCPTLSQVTPKFARQSHAAVRASLNDAFHRL